MHLPFVRTCPRSCAPQAAHLPSLTTARKQVLRGAWLALLLLLSACATAPSHPVSNSSVEPPVPLLLISLDGVRPDYLQPGTTPHLSRLAGEGVHAQWMNPSYPSLTFPNHYTLVTGLRPDHHGIVNNTMWDEHLGDFALSNREAVGDARWWSGEPIWVSAEKAGIRTATLFWPGSEAAVQGVRPWQWRKFDTKISIDQRVDQILEWLSLPAAERPRLVTLYFEHVDGAGHDGGPDSAKVTDALRQVDAGIGKLMAGLQARGLADRINMVVVSDHGMTATSPQRTAIVEDLISADDARAVSTGQVVGFAPNPGREAVAEQTLLGKHGAVECWRKQDMPARWHYGTHPRIPPIVCQADEGWLLIKRATYEKGVSVGWRGGGAHGYDPALPSMRAIFIAHGPAFRERMTIPGFDNVDVYPLLARLVGVPPAANDGDAQTLLPILKPDSKEENARRR
jgi:predicted AlkP superfamily pyrophosphatase or phosphodiesterase